MRVIFLLSLGTIAACAPAQSSPGFIFPCWFISWVWSLSFLHLLLLFLLLLFLNALALIFSVTRSFSLPEFSFFQSARRHNGLSCVTPRWSCGALPGLAALGLVARRSSASPGSAPMARCACDSKLFYGRPCTPLPTPIASPRSRRTGALQCSRTSTLLLVGRTGW